MLTICRFFPEALIEIENLKEINLHGNHISFISENLDKVKELKYLNSSMDQIYELEYLNFPKQMKYLELQENAIVKLPYSLLKQKYLELLNISNHKIEHLPAYSRQFENIEKY